MELASDFRGDRPSTIIMLDVDGLKELNDTHGHAGGDVALRELVVRCKACLGSDDLVGRLSGDEFAIFLPGSGEAKAGDIVHAIRGQLDAYPVPALGRRVSASFGIATAAGSSPSLSQLLQAADQAMYLEKRNRRPVP